MTGSIPRERAYTLKDRGWDEDSHMLRRAGLGEAFATLVNAGLNTPRSGSRRFVGLGVVGATVPGLRSQFVHLPSG